MILWSPGHALARLRGAGKPFAPDALALAHSLKATRSSAAIPGPDRRPEDLKHGSTGDLPPSRASPGAVPGEAGGPGPSRSPADTPYPGQSAMRHAGPVAGQT